jgi:hypothetical protein
MLAEADYGLTEMAHNGQSNRFAGDETLLVQFYTRPHLNQTKTTEAGRPIYEDAEYIRILQPGNKDSIIERPARDTDRQRFPKHYQHFKSRQEGEFMSGTPLSEWPGVSRAQVEELKYFNIHTLEQLVGMPDVQAQKIMGVNLLKDRAKKYLEAAQVESAAAAIKERDDRIVQLEGVISKLSARLDALEEAE